MKARLLKDARIRHKAGEIVEVSPAEFNFLASTKQAVPYEEEPVEKPKRSRKKTEV